MKIAKHYKVETIAVEQLQMKSKDSGEGRKYNKLVNNFWIKNAFFSCLKKHCLLSGIKFQEIFPQYSSFIGQIQHPEEENGIAASKEIARRGDAFNQMFVTKRIPKGAVMYLNFDKGILITRWKKFKEFIQPCQNWIQFYNSLKIRNRAIEFSLKMFQKTNLRFLGSNLNDQMLKRLFMLEITLPRNQ